MEGLGVQRIRGGGWGGGVRERESLLKQRESGEGGSFNCESVAQCYLLLVLLFQREG